MIPMRAALCGSGAVALGLFVAVQALLGDLRPNLVVLQLSFDAAGFRQVLDMWGPAGVVRYRQHFALDFGFLLAYALFGVLAARQLAAAWPGLAAVAAVFDAGENGAHLWLLALPAPLPPALVAGAALLASMKWLALLGWVVTLGAAVSRHRTRRTP